MNTPIMQFNGDHRGYWKIEYMPESGKICTMYSTTKESALKFIAKQKNKCMDYAKKQMFGSLRDNVGKSK